MIQPRASGWSKIRRARQLRCRCRALGRGDRGRHNPRERAKLAGEMSPICHKYLQDSARRGCHGSARAIVIDPGNADALRVSGQTRPTPKSATSKRPRASEPVLAQLDGLRCKSAWRRKRLPVRGCSGACRLSGQGAEPSRQLDEVVLDDASSLCVLRRSQEHGMQSKPCGCAKPCSATQCSLLSPSEEAEAELRSGEALTKLGRNAGGPCRARTCHGDRSSGDSPAARSRSPVLRRGAAAADDGRAVS